MSGVEALALLGAISSVVALIEASQKIYSAASNATGLHESFRQVAENIPIVLRVLKEAENTQARAVREYENTSDPGARKMIEDRSQAVRPVVASCRTNIEGLQDIFQSIIPNDKDSRFQRYKMAVRSATPKKQRKVKQLYKDSLEKLQLLHHYEFLNSQTQLAELGIVTERVHASPLPANPVSPYRGDTINRSSDTEKESDYTFKQYEPLTGAPNMVWQNFPGSKVLNQGNQVMHGVQNITL